MNAHLPSRKPAVRRKTAFMKAQAHAFVADPFLGRTVADEFVLVALLGVGAQGRVYRALQKPFDRPVAVKIFTGEAIATDEARVRAFREAQALGALTDPGIPRLVRFGHLTVDGQLADGYYLALELLEGRSLRTVLEEEGTIAPRRALEITRGILSVMAEMQRHGIAHRDIKPSHVLLTTDAFGRERVSLIDFGIARREGGFEYEGGVELPSEQGRLMGSPAYIAPEPLMDDAEVTGPAGDQYSLGVMLFEMLTGFLPFDGSLQEVLLAHVMDRLPALGERIDPTGHIDGLLAQATAKWAKDRFVDPVAMDAAVAEAIAALDEAARAQTPRAADFEATMKLPPEDLLRPSIPRPINSRARQLIGGIVVGVLAAASSAAGAVWVSLP